MSEYDEPDVQPDMPVPDEPTIVNDQPAPVEPEPEAEPEPNPDSVTITTGDVLTGTIVNEDGTMSNVEWVDPTPAVEQGTVYVHDSEAAPAGDDS